jgi:hypothetical protein
MKCSLAMLAGLGIRKEGHFSSRGRFGAEATDKPL